MGYFDVPERDPNPPDMPEAREIPVTVRLSVCFTLEVPFIKLDDETDDELERQVRAEHDHMRKPEKVWAAAKDKTLDDFMVVEIVEED